MRTHDYLAERDPNHDRLSQRLVEMPSAGWELVNAYWDGVRHVTVWRRARPEPVDRGVLPRIRARHW